MPELPECETIVRALRPTLSGKTVVGFMTSPGGPGRIVQSSAEDLFDGIIGQVVQTVLRRGKYIIMPLINGNVLVFHLGMTGQLLLSAIPEDADWIQRLVDVRKTDHCHFAIDFADEWGEDVPGDNRPDMELAFHDVRTFGKVWLVRDAEDIENLDVPGLNLGPDAIDITLTEFANLLKGKRTLKSLLLDQTQLAGVGNIYADEACFVAKVHPARTTDSLNQAETAKLWLSVKTVLKEGISFGGSSVSDYVSANGEKGSYQQKHRVYKKTDEPCVECATPIVRTKIVGRSTHFCPKCQPLKKGN